MIRLALVGFGGYGFGFVERFEQLAPRLDCKLVAAADNRHAEFPDYVGRLRGAGVEIFDDALAMFERLRGKLDAVYIATGIGSHAFLACTAMRAGFPIHLEKPPAATMQEMDQMLAAMTASGQFCQVGFQSMHAADILAFKDAIVSGRVGQVRSIVCHCGWPRDAAYYARNEWAGKLRSGRNWVLDGPATNANAHQLANTLFLASPISGQWATPTKVRAELYAAGPVESHNTAAIEIQTAEGPVIRIFLSHATQASWNPTVRLEGTAGRIDWQDGKGGETRLADGSVQTIAHDPLAREKMVENFVLAVRANDPSGLRCPLIETRKMVLAIDGAYESSQMVHRIPDRFVRRDKEGTPKAATIVEGLDAAIHVAVEGQGLLSDLSPAPEWAVRTQPFDMSGYSEFPKQFRA